MKRLLILFTIMLGCASTHVTTKPLQPCLSELDVEKVIRTTMDSDKNWTRPDTALSYGSPTKVLLKSTRLVRSNDPNEVYMITLLLHVFNLENTARIHKRIEFYSQKNVVVYTNRAEKIGDKYCFDKTVNASK